MSSLGKKVYLDFVKSILDRLVAVLLVIVCLPIGIFLILLLSIANRGRVFFLQSRIGKKDKVFTLFKFRTIDERGSSTVFGTWIRKLSIDELPQLLNVLKGEMSLVGPRPLLVEYLEYYDEKEKSRHDVLPGITGWAQVNGRNLLDWKSRMEHDIYYVKNASFLLDLKILAMTVIQLLKFNQSDFLIKDQETFIEYSKKR